MPPRPLPALRSIERELRADWHVWAVYAIALAFGVAAMWFGPFQGDLEEARGLAWAALASGMLALILRRVAKSPRMG